MALIEGASEGELIRMMKDCLSKLEGCCRQMAHKRGDTRWLKHAGLAPIWMQRIMELDKATGLRGTVILPEPYRRPNWH